MRRLSAITSAVLAMLLLTSASSIAQDVPDPVEPNPAAPSPLGPEPESFNITPFLGFGTGGDLENVPATFGAALGYGLNERWSVEGEFAYTPNSEQGILTEFDTRVWTLSANALYHFRTENFSPYLTAGLGLIGAEADLPGPIADTDDGTTELAWNWGGGLKTAMNENWGLRADLRYFNGDDLAPDHWRLYGGLVFRRIGR
jgi:opacity protein-like surface antigen